MSVRCYVSLGGNVGDVAQTFRSALADLSATAGIQVATMSALTGTRPVGQWAGGEFTNAAAAFDTTLDPLPLLVVLQDVERRHGRKSGVRWGPRTLDLDLVFYGDRTIDDPRLTIPHPASWYRRFVLDPLSEIAGDVLHPLKQQSVAALRSRLLRRPLRMSLAGSSAAERKRLQRMFTTPEIQIAPWDEASSTKELPELLVWLGADDERADARFDQLPLVPRLDASAAADRVEFVRHALHSALG